MHIHKNFSFVNKNSEDKITMFAPYAVRILMKCIATCLFLLTYLLTYLLHGAESFLRSYLVLQLLKKFPAFYETPKFITIFTSARHLSLS